MRLMFYSLIPACVCVFLLLVTDGRVLSWGRADYGQLGLTEIAGVQPVATPMPKFVSTPSEVVGLRGICQVRQAPTSTTTKCDCVWLVSFVLL